MSRLWTLFSILIFFVSPLVAEARGHSKKELFTRLAQARIKHVIEIDYVNWRNEESSKPYFATTGSKEEDESYPLIDLPQRDIASLSYRHSDSLKFLAFQVGETLICYRKSRLESGEFVTKKDFSHCFAFAYEISSIVERMKAIQHGGQNGPR